MMKSVTIPYRQETHGDFDAEWPVQRGVSGWWYISTWGAKLLIVALSRATAALWAGLI